MPNHPAGALRPGVPAHGESPRKPLVILPVLEAMEPRLLLSLPTSFTPVGYGGTGTSYWAMVNPQNTSEIYLDTDMGEVWHTTNGAQSWVTLSDTVNGPIQPTGGGMNTNVQYSGTAGTAFSLSNGMLVMTTNGGSTWAQPSGWSSINHGSYYPCQVLADPNSGNLVVTENHYQSSGALWLSRVWFSSNAGQSFTQLTIASQQSGNASNCFLAGAFWNGQNIYLATNFGLYTSSNGGSSWSTSTIGGINYATQGIYSFTGSQSGATTRLYAVIWQQSAFATGGLPALGSGFVSNYVGLYSVDIGQANWTDRDGTFWGAGGTYKLYPQYVDMANNDISDVWIGGGDAINYDTPIVYHSTDAGVLGTSADWTRLLKTGYGTWASIDGAPNANIETHQIGTVSSYAMDQYDWGYGGDTATFTVLRNNPLIMTFTNGGDAFITTDGGANWRSILAPQSQLTPEGHYTTSSARYSSTASETSVWGVAFADPQDIVASCTDCTALQSSDAGTSWNIPLAGAGSPNTFYQTVYDWRTGTLYAVTAGQHDLYADHFSDGEVENGTADYLEASYDDGLTWTVLHNFGADCPAKAIALDPTRPNRLYVGLANHNVGVGGVWYTDDLNDGASAVWTCMANQPMRSGAFSGIHPEQLEVLNNGDLVGVFAGRTDSSGNSTRQGGIWVLPGGNVTGAWIDRSGSLTDPNNYLPDWAYDVTIDPNDPTQQTWYAGMERYGYGWYNTPGLGDFMYKSTNGGQTWSIWGYVNNSTPPFDVSCTQALSIVIVPGTTEMFIGMKLTGLYYCADYTAATPVFTQTSFPFWHINSMAINPFNPDQLWITTFGNGMYTANIGPTAARPNPVTDLSASATNGTFTANWSDVGGESGYYLQYSDNSRSGADNSQANWTTVTLPAGATTWSSSSLPVGTFYFRVMAYNSSGVWAPVSNIATAESFAPVPNVAAIGTGPSDITVTWTDIAGASGYEVQKSLDGVNWSQAGTAATGQATGITLTGLAANTQYSLRMRATANNSQGVWSTTVVARTIAATGLQAYDDFIYPAGSLGAGANQGSGWAGPWSNTANVTVSAAGLTPPVNLATSGGSVSTNTGGGAATRNLTAPLSSYGTTVWTGVLIKPDLSQVPAGARRGGIEVGNAQVEYVQENDGNWHWEIASVNGTWYGSHWNAGVNPLVTSGQTYFVVLEEILSGGSDTVYAWINPPPGAAAPSTASAFDTRTGVNAGDNLSAVILSSNYYANTGFDELRIGTTYASVAPIPVPAGTTGITAAVANSTTINLTWADHSAGETGYHVQSSTDNAAWTTIATLAAGANSYQATGLTPGVTYYFRASAYDSSGDSLAPSVQQMAPIPGDINCDGLVDVADYNIWAANVGVTTATWSQGDLNGDGLVDVADYNIWAANVGSTDFGEPQGRAATSTPSVATASATRDVPSQGALPPVTAPMASTPAPDPQAAALPDVRTSARIDTATSLQPPVIAMTPQQAPSPVCPPAPPATSLAVAPGSDFEISAHAKAMHFGDRWAGVDGRPGDFTADLLASPLDDFDLHLI
jgi:hypothetical protein